MTQRQTRPSSHPRPSLNSRRHLTLQNVLLHPRLPHHASLPVAMPSSVHAPSLPPPQAYALPRACNQLPNRSPRYRNLPATRQHVPPIAQDLPLFGTKKGGNWSTPLTWDGSLPLSPPLSHNKDPDLSVQLHFILRSHLYIFMYAGAICLQPCIPRRQRSGSSGPSECRPPSRLRT
jgi:hypothetical protein